MLTLSKSGKRLSEHPPSSPFRLGHGRSIGSAGHGEKKEGGRKGGANGSPADPAATERARERGVFAAQRRPSDRSIERTSERRQHLPREGGGTNRQRLLAPFSTRMKNNAYMYVLSCSESILYCVLSIPSLLYLPSSFSCLFLSSHRARPPRGSGRPLRSDALGQIMEKC